MAWFVYVLRCDDGSLYTGSTNDVSARVAIHNAGKGAKYTRARLPAELVWRRKVLGRSTALRLEAKIKKLSRAQKLLLIVGPGAVADAKATRTR